MRQASRTERPADGWPLEVGAAQPVSVSAIVIAVMMAICFVGLSHDASYIGNNEEISVERGAGLKEHEKFEKDVNAAPATRKLAFLAMIGIGGYCLLTRKRNVSLYFGPTAMLMAACLVLIVTSILWSTDRGQTAREIIRILAYFFIAASLALRFRPREICAVLAAMGLGSVICALSVELLTGNFRPWLSDFRLRGSIHSNVLASHAMVTALVCFAFWRSSRRPWMLRVVLLAMLGVILLTKTRGALATSGVGMGIIFFAGKSPRAGILAISLLLTTMCLGGLLYVAAGSKVQARVQNALLMGRSEGATTLTGRLPLWKELWRQSSEHRWVGFGYGAFWTTDQMQKLEGKLKWYPGHSHSVYVQTILDVGLFGIVLFLALALTCLRRAYSLLRTTQDPAYYFILGFLVAGFVDGLVEVSFVYPRGLGLLVAIAMFSLVMVHAPLGSPVLDANRKRKPEDFVTLGLNDQSQFSFP